jgi:hypothetical protein
MGDGLPALAFQPIPRYAPRCRMELRRRGNRKTVPRSRGGATLQCNAILLLAERMARNPSLGRRQPTAGCHTAPWEQRVSAWACARTARRMRKGGRGGMGLRAPPIGLRSDRDKRQQHPDRKPRMVSLQDDYPEKMAQCERLPQSGERCMAFRRQGKERRARARSRPFRLASG